MIDFAAQLKFTTNRDLLISSISNYSCDELLSYVSEKAIDLKQFLQTLFFTEK